MRAGVHARHGVLRSGRRCRCESPLHDVLHHGGVARLANIAHITDAATAAPVADGTTYATAADATPDATATTATTDATGTTATAASAAPASGATLCVRERVVVLRGVPLRHRQLLMLDNRQTFNLDYEKNIDIF